MFRPKPQRPAVIDDQYFQQAREAAVIPLCSRLGCGLDPWVKAQRERRCLDLWSSHVGDELSGDGSFNCTAVCSARELRRGGARLALRFHHRRADDLFALLDHPIDEVGPRRCLGAPLRRSYALQMLIDR